MEGLGGLNKRGLITSPEDCYLTPPWAVSWLLDRWTPAGAVVCDPCACGYGGWSIGGAVGAGRGIELFDVEPRGDGVLRADFRELVLEFLSGGRTIITNPPYRLLPEFVRWALVQPSVLEVVILTRFGFLCAEGGRRAEHIMAYYQPARRLAFELLPEEGRRRIEHNEELERWVRTGACSEAAAKRSRLDVHADPRCRTGYRMSSTGVDHGWAVYHPRYSGPALLSIGSADRADELTPF